MEEQCKICGHIFSRGRWSGTQCQREVVFGEDYCANHCHTHLRKISPQFQILLDKFSLYSLNGTDLHPPVTEQNLWVSKKYNFIVRYDGQLHLHSIWEKYEDSWHDGVYYSRSIEPNTDQKELAKSLGIIV